MGKIIFISGAVRSGKSSFALELAGKSKKVVFVATGIRTDLEMTNRIELHKKTRPKSWKIIEESENLLRHQKTLEKADCIIIDCITFLVSNLMLAKKSDEQIIKNILNLTEAFRKMKGKTVLVSNEVGMGIVPPYKSGRIFRDIIGKVNQTLAKKSDRFYFLISGMKMRLK